MFLIFRINLVLFILNCCPLSGQENTETKTNKYTILYDDSRQKIGDISLSYQSLNTTGNNFLGLGYNGKSGYNLNLRLFVYKQLFLGATIGSNSLKVTDTFIIGNINSTDLRERFLSIGYEFLPFDNMRLGVTTSFSGNVRLLNSVKSTEGNLDDGNLRSHGIYVSYEFHRDLSIFVDYAFRKIKSNIQVPQGLETIFKEGTYQTLNIGLRFSFGNRDVFKALTL